MPETRRQFLHATLGMAAGLAATTPAPATPPQARPHPLDSITDDQIKIPRIKFGTTEISRMILGVNPFYGYGHYNGVLDTVMREWYTPDKVVEVLRRAERLGINAYNYAPAERALPDFQRYLAEGGQTNVIAQANTDDPAEIWKAVRPMAAWVQGERVDNAFRAGKMETIRDYCRKLRDLGVRMVGVGSHIPEVLSLVEEQNWDVDFYAGCVYNRRRTPQELRKLLGGELPEMSSEVYLQDDPPRMYKVFRQTKKPCVAFKILAAGRVSKPETAFKLAFSSIKPIDMVCVGVFPRAKDEVKENAWWTTLYGAAPSAADGRQRTPDSKS
jgi:hypothetical protein